MGRSEIIAACFYLKCVHSSTLHSATFIETFLAHVFVLSSLPFAIGVVAEPVQNGGYHTDYCYHGCLGHGLSNSEVNISHKTTTMIVWIYDGI